MASDSDTSFSFSIDLPVRNEWRNVDLLRTSVQNCFQAVFSDLDGCNALAMVTGELLENAMKYGDWEGAPTPQTFRLVVRGDDSRTQVVVQNPVRPDDPGLAELQRTLEWIRGFKSPGEAYRARLLAIASSDDEQMDSSKLGLVRIAYEGNCAIDAAVEGRILTVTAELRL